MSQPPTTDCPNCPNCGEPDQPLYVSESGITHCGCYHDLRETALVTVAHDDDHFAKGVEEGRRQERLHIFKALRSAIERLEADDEG